jgi:hypothetical protein
LVDRAICGPSSTGARAISQWAVDIWPYINGKALTQGIRLEEMDMSDMLDVLHYYMEEDYNVSNQEQIDSRANVRKAIYKLMYSREYKFPNSKNNTQVYANGLAGDDFAEPVDPLKGPTKSYVPPTDFNPDAQNPFGDVLDAPLGY